MSTNRTSNVQSLESRTLLTAVPMGPQSVLADMNGDGKADLVALSRMATNATPAVSVGIALGRGDGTFAPSDRIFINANTGFALAVGDLDGDGKMDVGIAGDNPLSAAPINGTFVVVAAGKGDGKFKRTDSGAPVLMTSFAPRVARATGLAIADVDGNGLGDVCVLGADRNSTSTTNTYKPVIVVNWDPTAITLVAVPPTVIEFNPLTYLSDLRSGDLDGDGHADLVAHFRTPLPPTLLTVIRPDLAVVRFETGHTPIVRAGVNPLNQLPVAPTPTAPQLETFGLIDLDGDDKPELVGRAGNTLRYLNYGNTGFGAVQTVASANTPPGALSRFQAGDITGDGLGDVMAASRYGPVVAVNITDTVAIPGVAVRWSRVPIGSPTASLLGDEQTRDELQTLI